MKDEEIKRAADSFLDSLIVSGCIPDINPDKDDEALNLVVDDMRALVAQAYEGAARLQTEREMDTGDPTFDSGFDEGYRQGVLDYQERLRALKDSVALPSEREKGENR